MTGMIFTFEDGSQALSHHGVKGMKWGVRRYQNEDGSYKPGAEGRYNNSVGSQKGSSADAHRGKSKPINKASGYGGKLVDRLNFEKGVNAFANSLQGGGSGSNDSPSNEALVKNAQQVQNWDDVSDDGNAEQYIVKDGMPVFKSEDGMAFTIVNGKYIYGKDPNECVGKAKLNKAADAHSARVKKDKIKHSEDDSRKMASMTGMIFTFEDGSQALSHYGVKGMKWGVRRYQNPDGSLTPAGAKRYGLKEAKRNYRENYANIRGEYARSQVSNALAGKGLRGTRRGAYENASEYHKAYGENRASYMREKGSIKSKYLQDKGKGNAAERMERKYEKKALRSEFSGKTWQEVAKQYATHGVRSNVIDFVSDNGSLGIASGTVAGRSKKGAVAVTALLGGTSAYYLNRNKYVKDQMKSKYPKNN